MYGNQVEKVDTAAGLACRPQTLTERLTQERATLESRLKEINSVIDQLEANPEIQNIFDTLARVGHNIY